MTNLALVNDNVVYAYDKRFNQFFEEYLKGHSENTAKGYRTDITQFCEFTFKKEPKYVTIAEMLSLTSLEARIYHNHLKNKKPKPLKNASIKRKIDAVRSLLNALKVDNKDINENIFDNIKIDKPELDRESWGNIEWDEAFLFIEYAHIEQMEGNQMAMLLKLACISSIRLECLLSLTWEDNFRVKNEKGVLVNYIDAVDKDTRHETPISNKFYNELRSMLGVEGNLFPDLHPHKVGDFLREIKAYFEIDSTRNIAFHSFKKSGINRVIDKTGSLSLAQIQGKHKSMVTTNTHYVKRNDDLTQKPSYRLDDELDVTNDVESLSHEELKQAIYKLSETSKFELQRIILKG